MNTELHLSIKNDLAELSGLMEKCETLLVSNSVAARAIYAVNLILEEILTNIIKYAYQDQDTHEIQVELHVKHNAIRIHFQDDGAEFDPRQAPEPDLNLSLEQTRIGGLGLHLIRANAHRMDYKREAMKNCLTVHLSSEAE